MKKTIALMLALLMLAGLLAGCGAGEPKPADPNATKPVDPAETADPASAPTEDLAEEIPEGAVAVSTVDKLLAALGSDTTILLHEGDYDLSTASDYASESSAGNYRWELVMGGAMLVLEDLNDLRLIGQGQVQILATPRYAEVLSLRGCWNVSLEGLTLGHTQEPGACAAGVLSLSECEDVTVEACRLFGCGSEGLTAMGCKRVTMQSSQIDSCSQGAVIANSCEDLRLTDCSVLDCGKGQDSPAGSLFYAERCRGFALLDSRISGNRAYTMLNNYWSDQTVLLGCQVENNRFHNAFFQLEGRSVTVDGCSFQRRNGDSYYADNKHFALSQAGEELLSFDLDHMELAPASYDGPKEPEPLPKPQNVLEVDGWKQVEVSTVDELLGAIAPDTIIVLAPGVYELSQAECYGVLDGEYWDWEKVYDGYSVKISGVQNFRIVGAGKLDTQILAEPRYAAVFSFDNCENVMLSGFTAGHSPEPAACAGNVIDLTSCRGVEISDCGLFGCGVIGICAWGCDGIDVTNTEIYDCSWSAATFDVCSAVTFSGCSIHDCDDGLNDIRTDSAITWDGEELDAGSLLFDGTFYRGAAKG